MKNNIAILAFLAIGAIFSGLILFLGKTYISVIYGLSLGVFITVLSFIAYFLYKKSEFSKNEDYLENTVSVIESIIPEVPRKTISSVVKAYFYRHLLNIFVLIALFIAGLFASILLIKQNDIMKKQTHSMIKQNYIMKKQTNSMKDQNYLICQQNNYLAFNKRFNMFPDPNEKIYNFFNIVSSELNREIEYFADPLSFSMNKKAILLSMERSTYKHYLPQKELEKVLTLKRKILLKYKTFPPKGQVDILISLISEYRHALGDLDDAITIEEEKLRQKSINEKMNFTKNYEKNCTKYTDE